MIDVRSYGAVPDGTTDCASAINTAIIAGDIIIKDGVFLLSESIKIPSNRTAYIKNAKIKMADESYDNFFRNSDFVNGNSNCNIIGQGNAVLDGNAVNNDDSYATYGGTAFTDNAYHYNGIMFSGVNTFEISGLKMVDRMHFAGLFHKCTNGTIDDIFLNFKTQLANQDGFDFCWGCNNITINNYRVRSSDDTTLLNVGNKEGFVPKVMANYDSGDIHDIDYTNVIIYGGIDHAALLPIIAGEGNKIYDCSMSNVTAYLIGAVIFSNYVGYWTIPPAKEDISGITIDNITVVSNSRDYLCVIGESCQNIAITNLTNNSGKALYSEEAALDVVNFKINGVEQSA
jgi:polygalacturonase